MATLPQWIDARVIQKIATEAEWNAITLVPYKGEVCLVGDSGGKVVNIKIGDGINTFPSLNYMFDSIQQNVGYIAIESNALPTPLDDVAWGMVTGGTYTFGGSDVFTVPDGHWGIANYSSGAWSLVDMGELPEVQGVDNINPEGESIPKEKAVAKYAPSKQEVGILSIPQGENIIKKYTEGDKQDTSLFDINVFYNKADGVKGTGNDFIATKDLVPVLGGYDYEYRFQIYGSAGICFFDENGIFVNSIGTTQTPWPVLEDVISLDPSIRYMGVTFSKGLDITGLYFRPTETIDVTTDNVFILTADGVRKKEVVDTISTNGEKVVNEKAVRNYTPSYEDLGIKVFKENDDIFQIWREGRLVDDETAFEQNMFLDKRTGLKGVSAGFVIANDIEVKGGQVYSYKFWLSGFACVGFFDANGVMVQQVSTTNSGTTVLEGDITLNPSVVSMSASIPKNQSVINQLVFQTLSDYTIVEAKIFNPADSGDSNSIAKNSGNAGASGDSTTAFSVYPDTVKGLLGYNYLNFGIGGTRMSAYPLANFEELSFYKIADAIASSDMSPVVTALNNLISGTSDPLTIERYTRARDNFANTDFATLDLFTIYFGTNDYNSSVPIGSVSLANKDTSTIVGALNYGIEKLQTAYPQMKLLVITPTHRYLGTALQYDSDTYTNSTGDSLLQVCNAIEQMANLNHIPCKNMYKEAYFNKYNHAIYFTDNVHFNTVGGTLQGRVIASFIKSNLF